MWFLFKVVKLEVGFRDEDLDPFKQGALRQFILLTQNPTDF